MPIIELRPPLLPPPIMPDTWDFMRSFMTVIAAELTASCLFPPEAPPDESNRLLASLIAMLMSCVCIPPPPPPEGAPPPPVNILSACIAAAEPIEPASSEPALPWLYACECAFWTCSSSTGSRCCSCGRCQIADTSVTGVERTGFWCRKPIACEKRPESAPLCDAAWFTASSRSTMRRRQHHTQDQMEIRTGGRATAALLAAVVLLAALATVSLTAAAALTAVLLVIATTAALAAVALLATAALATILLVIAATAVALATTAAALLLVLLLLRVRWGACVSAGVRDHAWEGAYATARPGRPGSPASPCS
jgi:hypothetical protein